MLYKLNVALLTALNFLYIFRSIAAALKIEVFIYLLSFLLLGVNTFFAVFTARIRLDIVSAYTCIGVTVMLFTMLLYPPLVGIIGFVVLFTNLMMWRSAERVFERFGIAALMRRFIVMNLYFACVIAIIGVYQYYVDASIMGLALHEIYGDPALMASGRYVRRVTSFLGSPQNYSLYIALTTTLIPQAPMRLPRKIAVLIILLIGGFVSGSRAYSVFVASTVLIFLGVLLTQKARSFGVVAKRVSVLFLAVVGIAAVLNLKAVNSTVQRMFQLFNDWPALQIFLEHLRGTDLMSFFLGRGIGVNERVVVQLLGDRYTSFVGTYVNSYESFILSIFMQLGIFGLIVFLVFYLKAVWRAYKRINLLYASMMISVFINLLFTPSFNGLPMSFIIWPVLLYPLSVRPSRLKRASF